MSRLLFLLFLLTSIISYGQQRVAIQGKVAYENYPLPGINIVNNTNQMNTITNERGEFSMVVKEGDILIFSSVSYETETTTVTEDVIANGDLVIQMRERMNFLEEVVVDSENEEAFLDLEKEQFKKIEYGIDEYSQVKNYVTENYYLTNGADITNLARLLFKSLKKNENENKGYKWSLALPEIFEDAFFVEVLDLKNYEIPLFLSYLDSQDYDKVFSKTDRFEIIDFLITESDNYKKSVEQPK